MNYFNMDVLDNSEFAWEDLDGLGGTFIVNSEEGFLTVLFLCNTGETFVIKSEEINQ